MSERNVFRNNGLSKFYLMAGLLIGVCCLPDLLLAQVESTPTFTEVSRQTVELLGQRDRNHRYYNVIREIEVADPNSGESRAEERISKVVEVGGGICYQDATGQWRLTDTAWRPTPEGFVMDQANYTLAMGRTADSPLIYTFEGRDMRLHADRIEVDNGLETVLLAQIQSGISGVIRPETPHKLLFANAFGPGIDLEYEALPGGYHQNVIFHARPELPVGFTPENSQIILLTELNLGEYLGTRGDVSLAMRTSYRDSQGEQQVTSNITAETLPSLTATIPSRANISFYRKCDDSDASISHHFAQSRIFQAGGGNHPKSIGQAAKQIIHDAVRDTYYLAEHLEAAVLKKADYPVVWDYNSVSGTITTDRWYADATYCVVSSINCWNCIYIEPGTVVKFAENATIFCAKDEEFFGRVSAIGEPYNYIYFTSLYDNTVGETYNPNLSTPVAYNGISCFENSRFQFCKFNYADTAIHCLPAQYDGGELVRDSIFTDCACALFIMSDGLDAEGVIDIFNNLFIGGSTGDEAIYLEVWDDMSEMAITNNTLDGYDCGINISDIIPGNLEIKNNLFTNNDIGIEFWDENIWTTAYTNEHHNGFYGCTAKTVNFLPDSSTDIFLTVSPYDTTNTQLGDYYLDMSSGGDDLAGEGDGLVGALYDDPCAWSVTAVTGAGYLFNANATIGTTAWTPHYNTCDTGTVDIGYHHPRVDYLIDQYQVTVDGGGAAATLSIAPGTVVAYLNEACLRVTENDKLECRGNAYLDDDAGYISMVTGEAAGCGASVIYHDSTATALDLSDARYDITGTQFRGLGVALDLTDAVGTVRDCRFSMNTTAIFYDECFDDLTGSPYENCLFWGNAKGMYFMDACAGVGPVVNCNFHRNGYAIESEEEDGFIVRNSIFHKNTTGLAVPAGLTESHNLFFDNGTTTTLAALSGSDYAYPAFSGAQTLTSNQNPFIASFAVSFLDRFYLNPYGTAATDHGYDPQTGGMPGYTTNATTHAADSGTIDIGYHYPLATDTDGDGLLDGEEYWAGTGISNVDSDGDGLVDGLNGKILLTVYTDGIDANEDGYVDGEHDEDMESNPALPDTDDDDYDDGVERLHGSDPDDDQSEPSSGTIDVPTQVYLIQNAIDYAIAGDEIILAPGEYTGEGNRDIDFSGKAVTVRGTDPLDPDVVAATMINCQGTSQDPHRGFLLINGEGTDSKIAGLTITNGYGPNITYGGYVYSAGGALVLYDSNPTFENICLHDNLASWGGAIYAVDAQYTLTNGLLYDNNADYGGAIYQENYTVYVLESNIINCTFSNNVANEEAGALYAYYFDQVSISNSIIWGNTATNTIYENVMSDASNLDFSYCDYQGSAYSRNGGTVGFTNSFASDPCFINAAGDDYHLKSTVGRWNPATSSWTTDAITSPCIDRGDPSDTYSNEPAPNGGVINLGYYGNTEQASKSSMGLLTVTITPTEAINAGAQWRLVYKSGDNYYYYDAYWRDSGDYIFNIMPGTYYLCVTDIEGYIPYNDLYGTSSIVTGYYPFILSSPITIGAGLNQEVIEYYEASVLYVSTVGDNNNTGHIYDPYLTIQHAISECTGSTGMRVYVYFGNYTENINVNKDIRIDGNGSVITGASGDSSVITVGNSATIDGFYVTGGNYDYGGGMRVIGAATVRDCIFYNNNAGIDGGALYCQGTFLEDTRFYNCYFGTVSSTNKVNNNPGDHSAEIYISSTPGPSYAYFSGCYLRGYALDLYGSYCDWPSKQW